MSRILAFDVGEKRIGVALSDELNIIAQALGVIERKDEEYIIERVKTLIKKYNVTKIVVGMPYNMNGTKGASARLAEGFVSLLKKEMPIEITMIDERLTTAQGERVLLEADVSRKKRKAVIDKIAAQLILQTYLDSR